MIHTNQHQTNTEPLLTPTEVAILLNIPMKSLYQWRYQGTGPPCHKIGRHLRYRRRDVEEWFEKQR
jgi:excisionase family DNA binding protein